MSKEKRKYEKMKWIISTICIILFLIIALYLIKINDNIIDTKIYNLIIKLKSDKVTRIFKMITALAGVKFIIIICVVVLFLKKLKQLRYFILLNLANDVFLNSILKIIFKRERPIDIMIITEKGYSFPSGHSMVACIFYGFIIYLISKSSYKKSTKIIINMFLIILIVMIGISRIYLGVHYASDVIGGYLVSISYLIIFTHFTSKYLKIEKDK